MNSSPHRSVPVYDPKSNQYLGFLDMLDIIAFFVNSIDNNDPNEYQAKLQQPCSSLIGKKKKIGILLIEIKFQKRFIQKKCFLSC